MTDVHPAALSDIDQDRAELRQLVDAAREHTDATCCEHRGVCSGDVVHDVLSELPADELQALLELAVAELAARPLRWQYGYPDPDAGPDAVMPFDGTPRVITPRMLRRPLAVVGPWEPALIEEKS